VNATRCVSSPTPNVRAENEQTLLSITVDTLVAVQVEFVVTEAFMPDELCDAVALS